MLAALLGLGTATPPLSLTRDESIDAARVLCAENDDQAAMLGTLHRQSGVEARQVVYTPEEFRYIVYGEGECDSPFIPKGVGDRGPSTAERMERFEAEALPIALKACREALEAAEADPGSITHLVTVSCTGLAAPGVDLGLMKALGMSPSVERTHVGFMGCHGALNGLRVARGLIAAEPGARVLLCSIELCSLHYSYGWNPKRMVGNVLFSDGSAAVVMEADSNTQRPGDRWRLAANGARLFPDSERAMAWLVRDHGFEMILSTRVPGLIQRNLRPWLDEWLAGRGLSVGEIGSWAVHPGGPRVLSGVGEALGVEPPALDAARTILARHGNMSSATVLFILNELTRQQAPLPCVAMGFGPGLAAEVALFV